MTFSDYIKIKACSTVLGLLTFASLFGWWGFPAWIWFFTAPFLAYFIVHQRQYMWDMVRFLWIIVSSFKVLDERIEAHTPVLEIPTKQMKVYRDVFEERYGKEAPL